MGHRTVDCRSLRKQLHELVNRGYLKEFILNPGQPSKVKVQKETTKDQQQRNVANHALVKNLEVDVIFDACPLEDTPRERAIYINEAREATTQPC